MSYGLPVINIAPLFEPDSLKRNEVVRQIDRACRESGFFYIQGHGISASELKKVTDLGKTFFAKPLKEKLKIDIRESPNHRGYGLPGAEQLNSDSPSDRKETFDMALNLPAEDSDVIAGIPLYGPNQYPDIDGFKQSFETYYQQMLDLGRHLLGALAEAMNLPQDYFDPFFTKPTAALRMIHYPELPEDSPLPLISAGKHSDYGCLTLLWQDNIGGLEVENTEGEWICAPPLDDSFVINIGDMMARWSNNRYRSTKHRVVQTRTDARYSMPFFLEPNFNATIECLPGCFSADNPPEFEPVKAGEWLQSRFAATYAYRRKSDQA